MTGIAEQGTGRADHAWFNAFSGASSTPADQLNNDSILPRHFV